MTWINDLDMCASAGIIEFDAPAYIKGTQARYYGHPDFPTIPGELPPMKEQPKKDEFKPSGDPAFNNPKWKKWLFGALAIGATVFGISKIPALKRSLSSISFSSLKNLPSKIWQGIQAGWKALIGLFKKTPTPPPTP